MCISIGGKQEKLVSPPIYYHIRKMQVRNRPKVASITLSNESKKGEMQSGRNDLVQAL